MKTNDESYNSEISPYIVDVVGVVDRTKAPTDFFKSSISALLRVIAAFIRL